MRPFVPILGALGLLALASSGSRGGGASPRSCAKKLVAAFIAHSDDPRLGEVLDSLPLLDADKAYEQAVVACLKREGDFNFGACKPELEALLTSALENAPADDLRRAAATLKQVAPQLHLHECLTALADQKLKASA